MAAPTPAEEAKKREEAAKKAQQDRDKAAGSRPAGSVVSAGAASTSNMTSGSIPPMEDPRGDRFFTADEIKSMAGDIIPGELAFLKLDENGTPVGVADRENPHLLAKEDGTFARVVGAPTHKYDEIVTPSGAPVTRFMNPDPVLWDAGMLARNPIPEETEAAKKWKVPPGAPVVNQPVTT